MYVRVKLSSLGKILIAFSFVFFILAIIMLFINIEKWWVSIIIASLGGLILSFGILYDRQNIKHSDRTVIPNELSSSKLPHYIKMYEIYSKGIRNTSDKDSRRMSYIRESKRYVVLIVKVLEVQPIGALQKDETVEDRNKLISEWNKRIVRLNELQNQMMKK